ncbi:MAG: 16S rRNA (guanine(966)-N(2))-methyltransferase RsmD [Myxococcales bacterium]|nr:16S rRNA (guanine(966)-N(2))-methyltransferase RsmD [Myxococcales bacterium]MCB9522333.1 16S rRNA (guanine(966)-N(2))-methyltransferase RsmD [Myxococcales bacterium]
MPRIIAGKFRGARLLAPPGDTTRPTADRVRESLFNVLQHRVHWPQAQVLDLFAGAGTLGCEALSRGAVAARFVERDRQALAALRKNVARFGPAATVHAQGVEQFLAQAPAPHDLIFLDPPYAAEAEAPTLTALVRRGWLAAEGLVCVEHPADRTVTPPAGLAVVQTRRYGATAVTLFAPEI